MGDQSTALDGWPIWDVHKRPSLAKEDSYGKLYAYLQNMFGAFVRRLRSRSVTFEMYCVNATELPKFLEAGGSARIEVHI